MLHQLLSYGDVGMLASQVLAFSARVESEVCKGTRGRKDVLFSPFFKNVEMTDICQKGAGSVSKKIVRVWGTVDNMNIEAFARKSGFRDLGSSPDLQIKEKVKNKTQESEKKPKKVA